LDPLWFGLDGAARRELIYKVPTTEPHPSLHFPGKGQLQEIFILLYSGHDCRYLSS